MNSRSLVVFGRFLEFISRGPIKSAIGERVDVTAYMLFPQLLSQSTLAKLGEILNKSRQAKSKLSNDFRDTFAGVKAPAMRPEVTRDRCCEAQLAGGLQAPMSRLAGGMQSLVAGLARAVDALRQQREQAGS